jgi:hypothetical protein
MEGISVVSNSVAGSGTIELIRRPDLTEMPKNRTPI